MLFMVIERFKQGQADAVYHRFREKGRMLPDGLIYLDSWVEENLQRCFQLMECDDPLLIEEWTNRWQDLVDFEVIQVIRSGEAATRVG